MNSSQSEIIDVRPPEEEGPDFGGCVAWAIENGAFALGMALMFSKTADLMTAFAPRTILGYSGVEVAYGFAVGVLIEGALFVMKLTLGRAKNVLDWIWNVIIVLIPFGISAMAQVFDSFQIRDNFASQPPAVQAFATWFIPSIPSVVMFLFIFKSVFSSIPKQITPKGMKGIDRLQGRRNYGAEMLSRVPTKFVGRFIGTRPPEKTEALPDPTSAVAGKGGEPPQK